MSLQEPTYHVDTVTIPAGGMAMAGRQVQLQLPARVMQGEPFDLIMTLLADSDATAAGTGMLEGRVDLPDADVFPQPVVTAPQQAGRAVSFHWRVTLPDDGQLLGRLWLSVVVNSAAGAENRQVLLARPLEVEVAAVGGFAPAVVRWTGIIVAAGALVVAGARWLVRRKGNQKPEQGRVRRAKL